MTRPTRFVVRMLLFLAAVGGILFFLRDGLIGTFWINPALNGLILGVLVLGIAYNLRQALSIAPEIAWIESFRRSQPGASTRDPPRLLAPMAAMLGERKGRLTLSATSMRTLLDGIASRLEESREISRYLIGLSIFLGLLGTFWGLLETVSAVSTVVGSLSATPDISQLFNDLQGGLKAPLSGMGTAFGTSLFGLAGSLVLGFLDLQAGQAQNRFYNELEEWLSGLTRLGGGGSLTETDQPVPAYIQALLEQTADNLENLQRTMARTEEGRGAGTQAMSGLTERLGQLIEQMRAEQSLMVRIAESQVEMKPLVAKLAEAVGRGGFGGDEATRGHLRAIEGHLARLIEETAVGRTQVIQDVRNEIRLLARTIAALAEDER